MATLSPNVKSMDAHDLRDFLAKQSRRVHLIGVGGAAMSGLARILRQQGHQVSGSDVAPSPALQALRRQGVAVTVGHAAQNAADADLTVYSSAINPDNPELDAAARRGTAAVKRAVLQGAFSLERATIAIAGTHGKTTTTTMIAHALRETGHSPAYMIGGDPQNFPHSAHWGSGAFLVVEADEFDRAFLELFPTVAVVTALEADHLDTYGSAAHLERAFQAFVNKTPPNGAVATRADSPACRRVTTAAQGELRTWSLRGNADWVGRAVAPRRGTGSTATLVNRAGECHDLALQTPGAHNVLNALACVTALDALNIPAAAVTRALSSFRGVCRRFELRDRVHGITVVDDYAHHPTEVRATLRAAREWHDGRVVCVFQPHLRSRTADLFAEFKEAFQDADKLILVETYEPPGRNDPSVVSSADLAAAVPAPRDTRYAATLRDALSHVTQTVAPGDLVITMGAGDITELCDPLLAYLHERAASESST